MKVNIPESCLKDFGIDLDGCSTAQSEGCGRCHLALENQQETYSEYIMTRVRQNIGLDEQDSSRDSYIMNMPKEEVLRRVLTWEGIIGFEDIIKFLVEDIYKVSLDETDSTNCQEEEDYPSIALED